MSQGNRPKWAVDQNTKLVWSNTGANICDTLEEGWQKVFGAAYSTICLKARDTGYGVFRLFPEGRVSLTHYRGGAHEIRILRPGVVP